MLILSALAEFERDLISFELGTGGSPTSSMSLWVPQTPHTSRDLLILVEKPTEQVMASDLVDLGCCPVGSSCKGEAWPRARCGR
jgi:hypothetical protein